MVFIHLGISWQYAVRVYVRRKRGGEVEEVDEWRKLDAGPHWNEIGIHPDTGGGEVPSYARVDVNVTWHPRKDLELTLGVQNLLEEDHVEFVPEAREHHSEVERMFYAQFVWRF